MTKIKENQNLINGYFFLLFIVFFILVILLNHQTNSNIMDSKNNNLNYNLNEINEYLNIINKNCGSTQIVHKYDDDVNWYVFVNKIYDNRNNYLYIPIKDCLNNEIKMNIIYEYN